MISQEKANRISVIVNAILTALCTIISSLTVTSCVMA